MINIEQAVLRKRFSRQISKHMPYVSGRKAGATLSHRGFKNYTHHPAPPPHSRQVYSTGLISILPAQVAFRVSAMSHSDKTQMRPDDPHKRRGERNV